VDYSSDGYHGIIVPDRHNAPFARLGRGFDQEGHGRGFDQEGTGSSIRERSGNAHQNAAEGGQEVVNPRNPSLEARTTLRRAAPGPSAPAMSVVRLDFEVFADVYRYSAYDSIAFASFVSILRNAILGLSPGMETEQLIIETHRLPLIQQLHVGVRLRN
jgi:hypothetical protein